MGIEAVTSGQDGEEAAKIACDLEVLWEIEEKYPGLLEILKDPFGSLYLNEGMYLTALRFLEDYVERNEKTQIQFLYSDTDLESYLVRSVTEKLLTVSGYERESDVLRSLEMVGYEYDVQGWDSCFLNSAMVEVLRKESTKPAERIETKPFYRWHEENKQHLSTWADMSVDLVYVSLAVWASEPARANQIEC